MHMDEAQRDRHADSALAGRLLRGGVALRHVRRTLRELRDHREDLVEKSRSCGRDREAALKEARGLLGNGDALAEQMIARPELRSRVRRLAWLLFLLAPVPLVCVMGLLLTAASVGVGVVVGVTPGFPHAWVSPAAAEKLALAGVPLLLQWVAPLVVGWQLCRMAARRCMPTFWPVCAMAIVAFSSGMSYFGKTGEVTTLTFGISTRFMTPWTDLVRISVLFCVLGVVYLRLRASQPGETLI
jgi:hypothetical protein